MADSVKRTEAVKVCFSEQMMLDINRRAIQLDRSVAELIYLWVRDRTYGECNPPNDGSEVTERDRESP